MIPLISITFEWNLSDLFLQRNRPFRIFGELWRVCGELWLYFDMQRRLELRSFLWLSWRSREAQNQLSFSLWIGRLITVPIPAGKFERVLVRHFSVDFQTEYIVGRTLSWSKRACFVFGNPGRNGRTAAVWSLPPHRFRDWSKTEAALKLNSPRGYPKYEKKNALHLAESFMRGLFSR